MKYRIVWDNGASACGEFDIDFDTEEEATAFGDNWVSEMKALDAEEDLDEDIDVGYSFEVVEKL